MASSNAQPRVILWSVPRSCTTAVLRSISNVEGGVFYFEPHSCAFCYGPEREQVSSVDQILPSDLHEPGADLAYDSSINTFAWVKQTLEAEHKDASLVFAKDFAYCLKGKMDRLPKGYCHSFLIRNPNKVIPSWRKLNEYWRRSGPAMDEQAMEEWNDIQMGKHAGYKDLLELYEYVKENLDPSPFIMDADDLLANPEAVMTAYCKATGIPFSKKLLEWGNDGLPMFSKWIFCRDQVRFLKMDYQLKIRTSRGFLKSEELMTTTSTPITNPRALELIQCCMPYYKKLYSQRFVP